VAALAIPARARAEGESIYELHPVLDGAIIIGSTALTATIYGFIHDHDRRDCACSGSHVNVIDRIAIDNRSSTAATVSDVTVGLAVGVPVVLDLMVLRASRPFFEDVVVYAESISVDAALYTIAKHIVHRPFPRTYAGDDSLAISSDGYQSFYSGHVATAFAALSTMAVTIGRRYDRYLVPWLITLAVGGSVAYGRVAAGWHFPTDTMVGALAGTAVGVAVPVLHFKHLRLTPLAPGRGDLPSAGLALAGRWP
jgi:membrane-associated phospholipid phosphatase